MTTSALSNLNEMTIPDESTTNHLQQKLLTTISTLQNNLKNLKSRQKYPQKWSHNGKGDEASVSHNGDNDIGHDNYQEPDPADEMEHNLSDGSCLILSEEVKAFLRPP